jgi:hypothetical protein
MRCVKLTFVLTHCLRVEKRQIKAVTQNFLNLNRNGDLYNLTPRCMKVGKKNESTAYIGGK